MDNSNDNIVTTPVQRLISQGLVPIVTITVTNIPPKKLCVSRTEIYNIRNGRIAAPIIVT